MHDIIKSYNLTQHRGLGSNHTPTEIHRLTEPDEIQLQFKRIYKTPSSSHKAIISTLSVGEYVRLSQIKPTFKKGYTIQNTLEIFKIIRVVTRPFYESRANWVVDPAPPASRRPATEASPAPMLAILMPPSGASSQPPRCQKSRRRRRRRKATHAANSNSASRQPDLVTLAAWSANENSARWRATQPRSAPNDRPEMRSTSVEHPHSFTSSPLTQLPIPTANQNSGSASRQDHSEIWGLYKPAQPNPRQDLTATLTGYNISGFGLYSPAHQQPSTKPFSGLPARHMTSPHREAGEAERERPGIRLPVAAPCRSPRHTAADRRCPARSCRPRPSNQATHGVGHCGDQTAGEPSAPRTAFGQAPIPQTPPQPLDGGL